MTETAIDKLCREAREAVDTVVAERNRFREALEQAQTLLGENRQAAAEQVIHRTLSTQQDQPEVAIEQGGSPWEEAAAYLEGEEAEALEEAAQYDDESPEAQWHRGKAEGYGDAANYIETEFSTQQSTTGKETPEQIGRRVREETERACGGEMSPKDRRAVESVIADVVRENFCPCGAQIERGTGGLCPSCIEHAEAD